MNFLSRAFPYQKVLLWILVTAFSLFFIICSIYLIPTKIWGDWQEYLMMQVGLAEFGKVHVVPEAAINAEKYIQEVDTSYKLYWKDSYLQMNDSKVSAMAGAYKSKRNGKYYFGHFFLYNILTIPAHNFCKGVGIPPFRAMSLTNALMIVALLIYLGLEKGLSVPTRIVGVLLAVFSPLSWYLDFKGPEVMTQASVFAAMTGFMANRTLLPVTIITISSMQNPSSAAFLLPVLGRLVMNKNWKKLFLSCLVASFICLPVIFNLYHFGKANIMASHALQMQLLSGKRLWSAFFDLQQGMIVGFPVTMPLFLFLVIYAFFKKELLPFIWIPVVIVMLLPLLTQGNWHPGQIRMLRYSAWAGMVFHAGVLWVFSNPLLFKYKKIALFFVLVTIFYFINTKFVFQQNYYYCEFNNTTRWILRNYPDCYNPEIEIFAECTFKYEKDFSEDSLIVYRDPLTGEVAKVAVRKGISEAFLRDTLGEYAKNHTKRRTAGQVWEYLLK